MILASFGPISYLLFGVSLAYSHHDASDLVARAVTSPAPVVVSPSQVWDGDDGSWSTFTFRVGTPAQNVRLLPSTASQQTLVILTLGCPPGFPPSCATSRGWLYDNGTSSTWVEKGDYRLLVGQNPHPADGGTFGFDTIGIGAQGTGGPTLDHQLLGGIATNTFYVGIFGLNPRATNYSGFNEPVPSYITSLKRNGSIPSISFGYTAGAPYQLKGVTGSLTLGGYDASLFTQNNLTFTFAPNVARDVVVGVQSITTIDASQNKTSLLSSGILAFVDSTDPYLYLPLEVCQKFENTFGLTWDNRSQLYLVNDSLHTALLARNPNFTFTLGNSAKGGQTIDITLPYASFDLQMSYPLNNSRFFPVKRAINDTQITLGRAFLQEAYLIVDWERFNFSISQCVFQASNPQRIVSIPPVDSANPPSPGSSLSTGAKVAIAVSVVFFSLGLLALVFAILFVRRKRRHNAALASAAAEAAQRSFEVKPQVAPESEEFRKAELDADAVGVPHEYGISKRLHIDLSSGADSMSISKHPSLNNFDVITPASELASPPIPMYELAAEEMSRPELTDTSEGPRYETAKARWKKKRAELGSHKEDLKGEDLTPGEGAVEMCSLQQPGEYPWTTSSTEASDAKDDTAALLKKPLSGEEPMITPMAGTFDPTDISTSSNVLQSQDPLITPPAKAFERKHISEISNAQPLTEYPWKTSGAESPSPVISPLSVENAAAKPNNQQHDQAASRLPTVESPTSVISPMSKDGSATISSIEQRRRPPMQTSAARAPEDGGPEVSTKGS